MFSVKLEFMLNYITVCRWGGQTGTFRLDHHYSPFVLINRL